MTCCVARRSCDAQVIRSIGQALRIRVACDAYRAIGTVATRPPLLAKHTGYSARRPTTILRASVSVTAFRLLQAASAVWLVWIQREDAARGSIAIVEGARIVVIALTHDVTAMPGREITPINRANILVVAHRLPVRRRARSRARGREGIALQRARSGSWNARVTWATATVLHDVRALAQGAPVIRAAVAVVAVSRLRASDRRGPCTLVDTAHQRLAGD